MSKMQKMKKKNSGLKTKFLWKNPEYKKHMSKIHKGQKAWNKGIPYTKTITKKNNNIRKRKISKTLKKLYKLGIRKPVLNFKFGHSIYRKYAFKLFKKICIHCNQTNIKKLDVHHKDGNPYNNPLNGNNWEILCHSCHMKEHWRWKKLKLYVLI